MVVDTFLIYCDCCALLFSFSSPRCKENKKIVIIISIVLGSSSSTLPPPLWQYFCLSVFWKGKPSVVVYVTV